jgi:hypothetical protein
MRTSILCGLAIALLASAPAYSQVDTVGVISHVNVTSDKVPDVSSLEAWKASFIKPGMTDQEKAMAVWRTVVMFRHQDIPPNEFLDSEVHVHDPIKSFNVYGYGQCCCASANVEALARYIGLETRGWGITSHSVPEINVNGQWCMFDASLINYFKKPDGSIAGVQEISGAIGDWYDQHPSLRNDNAALMKFMARGGWKNGPSMMTDGIGYDDNGWLPAATHGWYSNMQEFGHAKQNFLYEYGCALGYEVNIQLRPGETLMRNWSNKGLHVNMLDGAAPGSINGVVGKDQLRYAPAYGDIAPGRIGNGTLQYKVPLDEAALPASALQLDNIAFGSDDQSVGQLHAKDGKLPATLVLRMPSSYVYLGGKLTIAPIIPTSGSVAVYFSDNNGLDWRQIGNFTQSGQFTNNLSPLIFRRYDYRLKFVMTGRGVGVNAISIDEDVQHSQRVLPALDQGDNQIHITSGAQEGTITIEGATEATAEPKNLLLSDFHPQQQNLGSPNLHLTGQSGQLILPIETPGDMTRLRVGCHYRARDAREGWKVEVSFDGGRTYAPVGQLEGPHPGFSKYLIFDSVPAGIRSALVRFAGTQRNTTLILDLRISADYREPHGAFAPVRVTYTWEEDGRTKQDVHVAHHPDETYTIHCDSKPLMKAIALELAQ